MIGNHLHNVTNIVELVIDKDNSTPQIEDTINQKDMKGEQHTTKTEDNNHINLQRKYIGIAGYIVVGYIIYKLVVNYSGMIG